MSRKVPQSEINKMVGLYSAGMSLQEISDVMFMARTTVHRYLTEDDRITFRSRGGWTYNRNRTNHAELQLTIILYQMGWTTNEIAERFGIGKSTVAYRLHRSGIQLRPRSESLKLRNARRQLISKEETV